MNLKQIELFIAICETGSVTKGAQQLSLTQSTASQHLAALEEEWGAPLFERTGRGVKPTPFADAILLHALGVRESLRRLTEAAEVARGNRHRNLSIVAGTVPGNHLLPPLIPHLRRQFPHLRVDLRIVASSQGIDYVAEGGAEIGVSGIRPTDRRVVSDEVGEDRIILVVPPDHPCGEWIDPGDLKQEEFVVRRKGSGTMRVVESSLRSIGVDPEGLRVAAEVESSEALKRLVMAGVGIGFISRAAVRDELGRMLLREVTVPGLSIERRFYLVCRRGGVLSPPAQVLATLLRGTPPTGHPGEGGSHLR